LDEPAREEAELTGAAGAGAARLTLAAPATALAVADGRGVSVWRDGAENGDGGAAAFDARAIAGDGEMVVPGALPFNSLRTIDDGKQRKECSTTESCRKDCMDIDVGTAASTSTLPAVAVLATTFGASSLSSPRLLVLLLIEP